MSFEEIVRKLKEKNQKVSTMESCTGGALAAFITNVEGSSDVFEYGAVTYSNAFKIKMGVPKETIDTYTVYSMETAKAMAKAIATYSGADYGIGITGKLGVEDVQNPGGSNSMVYFSIYNVGNDSYIEQSLSMSPSSNREEMKREVIRLVRIIFENSL